MFIVSFVSFFVVLSTLILIHELGHFLAARKFGIWVEEFGLGLPPRAWGKKIGETIYSLNWLPFGGFVKLHGETTEEGVTVPERAFVNKSKKVRITVLIAGVTMNLLLGVVLFAIVYSITGIPQVSIEQIKENSPASAVGLKEGDVVKSVDGQMTVHNQEFITVVNENRGKELVLSVERDGKQLNLTIIPRENPPEGEGALGIEIVEGKYFPPIWQRPFFGVYYGLKDALYWGQAVLAGLRNLVVDLVALRPPVDIAGPVGIYQLNSQVCPQNLVLCLNFVGILSVNLAVINFLPIPALDGGRLFFILIETILRRKVTPKLEGTIHAIGMVVLLSFIVIISFFDIKRLADANMLPPILLQLFK